MNAVATFLLDVAQFRSCHQLAETLNEWKDHRDLGDLIYLHRNSSFIKGIGSLPRQVYVTLISLDYYLQSTSKQKPPLRAKYLKVKATQACEAIFLLRKKDFSMDSIYIGQWDLRYSLALLDLIPS